MHRRLVPGLLAFAFIALTLPAFADAPGVYALTGGTVHPVSGPEIPNGVVVIPDALIEAVGAGISIPPDAATIDVKGMHVYPGLIDAQTSLGFPSPAPSARGRRGAGAGARLQAQQPALPETSAAYLAARNVNLSDDDLDAEGRRGDEPRLPAPPLGIFNGQSLVVDLGPGGWGPRVVRARAAVQIPFTPRRAWPCPH